MNGKADLSLAIDREALGRLVRSLLAEELTVQRQRPVPPAAYASWPPELSLGESGLALDSLERLAIAGHLNQFFHLHETGIEDYLLAGRVVDDLVDVVATGQRDHDNHFTLLTSGSTGKPKPCTHSKTSLLQECAALRELVNDRRRVVGLVPAHHIYGFLFTVWLPRVLGVPFVDGRLIEGSLRKALQPGDLLIAVPDQWTYLSTTLKGVNDVVGVSATAPLRPETARALRDGCLVRLLEVFGSSESGGIGWRHQHGEPFELFNHWRSPRIGAVSGDAAVMTLSRECNGEITTHSLNDHLVFHGERRFEPGGRVDSAVQVGGHNVFPEVIADCLRQHPDIAECIVRLEGEDRLKAFIVPVPSGTVARSEDDEQRLMGALHRWCSERLKAHEVPRRFAFGASLPRNELGKIIDWSDDSTSI